MSLYEEISEEMKSKTQGTIQMVQQLKQLLEAFQKNNTANDETVSKLISDAVNNDTLTNFQFTGKYTDLSYFSQSDTMPLSAIKSISDPNIKAAVLDTFDKAQKTGLISLDGDCIRITDLGKSEINKPYFKKAAQSDQISAYNSSLNKMMNASLQSNEVQMCVGLSGDYMNDFTFFNHSDKLDLSSVISHPDKQLSQKVLANVKQWQKAGAVTVKNGVATITDMGKKMLQMPQFKAMTSPLTEKALATAGGMPGKIIVATKKVVGAVVQAVQSANQSMTR